MKQIAKWTLLCVLCITVGFGATVLVAYRGPVGRTLVAMLAEDQQGSLDQLAPIAAQESTVGTLQAAATPTATRATTPATATVQTGLTSQPGVLTAVGTVELIEPRQVVLAAAGRVDQINVKVGDVVTAGTILVSLDTTYLDWAVEQAENEFETARIDFEDLGTVEESDVAVAEANLLLAQETLAEVEAGPTAEELAAAESSAAAAWARLQELQEQPTQAQINQALANLKKAQIAVQAAQREYDKIAWLPEAAATEAADTLQQATVDLEAAQAAYEEASKPATESELQAATADAQSAQDALNELRRSPTPAQLAEAQATVAAAQATLETTQRGAREPDLEKGALVVRNAMIALDQARLARENADVKAPIDGTILTLDVELGQEASAGSVVATMADTANVQLVVNVEQKDISRVRIGQAVAISIYALPAEIFYGVVEKIAPVADAGTGFITFPVIIRMTEGPLELVLPGMTASAAFDVGASTSAAPVAGETLTATVEAPATPEATATSDVTATPEATPEATATSAATATPAAAEEEAEPATESGEEPAATPTAAPEEPEPTATPTASS
jgi:multidrug resistance efflux pump